MKLNEFTAEMNSVISRADCEKSIVGEEKGRDKEDKRQNTGFYQNDFFFFMKMKMITNYVYSKHNKHHVLYRSGRVVGPQIAIGTAVIIERVQTQ